MLIYKKPFSKGIMLLVFLVEKSKAFAGKAVIERIKNQRLFFICLIVAIFPYFGCSGTKVITNVNAKDVPTFCVFTNIADNSTRLFTQRLKEHPSVKEFPNCEYLLFVNLDDSSRDLRNAVGVYLQKVITITANYSLFKNDSEKYQQVINILETPMINGFPNWTSAKNAYMTRSTRNIGMEQQGETEGSRNVYNVMIARLNRTLKLVGGGSEESSLSFATSPTMLFAETQTQTDTMETLAKNVAEKVITSVILDIDDYDEKIQQQEQDNIKKAKNVKNTKKSVRNKK